MAIIIRNGKKEEIMPPSINYRMAKAMDKKKTRKTKQLKRLKSIKVRIEEF